MHVCSLACLTILTRRLLCRQLWVGASLSCSHASPCVLQQFCLYRPALESLGVHPFCEPVGSFRSHMAHACRVIPAALYVCLCIRRAAHAMLSHHAAFLCRHASRAGEQPHRWSSCAAAGAVPATVTAWAPETATAPLLPACALQALRAPHVPSRSGPATAQSSAASMPRRQPSAAAQELWIDKGPAAAQVIHLLTSCSDMLSQF